MIVCDSKQPEHAAMPLGALLVYGVPGDGPCHITMVQGDGRDPASTWKWVNCSGEWPTDPAIIIAWEHFLDLVSQSDRRSRT